MRYGCGLARSVGSQEAMPAIALDAEEHVLQVGVIRSGLDVAGGGSRLAPTWLAARRPYGFTSTALAATDRVCRFGRLQLQ